MANTKLGEGRGRSVSLVDKALEKGSTRAV